MGKLSLKPGDSMIEEMILCRNLLQAVVSNRNGQLHKYSTSTNMDGKYKNYISVNEPNDLL